MPIRTENKKRYPQDWPRIRAQILTRAQNCCEECGVPNHSVGYREADGRFIPLRGNLGCDAAGSGLLNFAQASEFAEHNNDHLGDVDADGHHWIVIVLTVAHLDHTPENCRSTNLKALCQQCHNRYDVASRQAGKIDRKSVPLFEAGVSR
jgi:5-methylcytosine-specific restriction endonuclease McrA